MNKVYSKKSGYSPVRFDRTRTIVSYGMEEVDVTHATWYEIYYYKKKIPIPSLEMIKNDIITEINAQTDEKIVSGFVWTPQAGGEPIPVWLSTENQFNFKSAYDLAVQSDGSTLPVTFKMGEDTEGNPIYHTFETMADANDFYLKAVDYVHRTLEEGWQKKDSIDWNDYIIPQDEPDIEPEL